MQSEFTALQGAIDYLTDLRQKFEQIRTINLNKYIIKMA